LVQRAANGEEIIIGKAGRPVAKLVPFDFDRSLRDLEQAVWKGKVWIASDFDELPDSVLQSVISEASDQTPI